MPQGNAGIAMDLMWPRVFRRSNVGLVRYCNFESSLKKYIITVKSCDGLAMYFYIDTRRSSCWMGTKWQPSTLMLPVIRKAVSISSTAYQHSIIIYYKDTNSQMSPAKENKEIYIVTGKYIVAFFLYLDTRAWPGIVWRDTYCFDKIYVCICPDFKMKLNQNTCSCAINVRGVYHYTIRTMT